MSNITSKSKTQLWHCCQKGIRSNFCPNCGTPRPVFNFSNDLSKKDANDIALELISFLDSRHQYETTRSLSEKQKADDLRKALEKAKNDDLYFLHSEISSHERIASGRAEGALQYSLFIKSVRFLLENQKL